MLIRLFWPAALIAALTLGGCAKKDEHQVRTYRMGENAAVGPLIYNVLETEWKTDLGEEKKRVPDHRFLLVTLSVTHSGGGETSIPQMTLEDPAGNSHREVNNGEGVSNWLGMLRNIRAAQTEHGVVIFDAPMAAYKLKVSAESDDPDKEQIAYIDLPLRLDQPEPVVPTPPQPAQPAPPAPGQTKPLK